MTQKETVLTFNDFKIALRNIHDTEEAHSGTDQDTVMKSKFNQRNNTVTCYTCGQSGHKSNKCKSSERRQTRLFCNFCKVSGHPEHACRKKKNKNQATANHILVDCCATTHIVTNSRNFKSTLINTLYVPSYIHGICSVNQQMNMVQLLHFVQIHI